MAAPCDPGLVVEAAREVIAAPDLIGRIPCTADRSWSTQHAPVHARVLTFILEDGLPVMPKVSPSLCAWVMACAAVTELRRAMGSKEASTRDTKGMSTSSSSDSEGRRIVCCRPVASTK